MESPDMSMYNTVLDRFPHSSMYGEGLYGISSLDISMYNTVLDRLLHPSMYGEGLYGIF